jgi:hypothetical protein
VLLPETTLTPRMLTSAESAELDIVTTESSFRTYDMPCKIISDVGTYETPLTSMTLGRCGVQFGDLTKNQISQLESFIHNHTVGET